MAENDTAVHAELAIAKADMRIDKSDQSAKEVMTARQRPWIQRTLALSVIFSFALGWVYGNIYQLLGLAIFWCISIPVFLFIRKQRLQKSRDNQLKKFREKQN